MPPPRRPPGGPPLLRVRILLWHARPFLVVGAVLVGALGFARALAPPPPATVDVVVTARDVGAGTELTAADLRAVRMPPHLVPEASGAAGAAGGIDGLVGRRTAIALPRGITVVEPLLAGDRFGIDPPAGTVVVPVALGAAAVSGLLRPGDQVDLVLPGDRASGVDDPGLDGPGVDGPVVDGPGVDGLTVDPPAGPTVLARGALVLDVGGATEDDGVAVPGLTAGGPTDRPVILVAVAPDIGRVLAAASADSALGAVLVP